MKFPYGYQADIKRIKAAGFSHIKVELEAQMDRGDEFYDEGYCETWLDNHLSDETSKVLNYSQFYNDGSVDSEYTFTLPVDEGWRSVEIMEAFKALGEANGYGFETRRAGMHITLLTGSVYPSVKRLPRAKLENFVTQVTKLLPALYAAGTHDGNTRPFQYRTPSIGPEKDGVYPAICTHDGTCLEYRLFDTCYDQPEAILEKFQIIASTLRYFDTRTKVDLKAKQFILENFVRGGDAKTPFVRTIKDLPNLQALRETMKYVKPSGTSMAKFLASRGLNLTNAQVQKFGASIQLRLEIDYAAYHEAYLGNVNSYLSRWLQDRHPNVATSAEVATVMPQFDQWYRSNVDRTGVQPKPFETWVQGVNRPSLYTNVLKTLDLTEPVKPAPLPRLCRQEWNLTTVTRTARFI